MNRKYIAFALSLFLTSQLLSPNLSFAATSVVIPGAEVNSGENTFTQQQADDIEQFLEEFRIVKKCLRNRPKQENTPINGLTSVCVILQVFDEQTETINKAWEKALKLKLIDEKLSKTQKMNGLDFLSIVFQAAGVTISPLTGSNYQSEFKKYRLRMNQEEFITLVTALEQGIISQPSSAEEARELRKKLTIEPLTVAQALAYLYQISTSKHQETIINILPQQNFSSPSLTLESTLKEIIATIKNQSYFSENFDEKEAMEAAIKAAIKTLEQDKYIEYYTEEEFQSFSNSLNGNLEGIGAYIEEKEGKIIIVSPIEGSPAAKAGILPGDIILSINGESTEKLSLQQAVDKIRGPQGTTVKLKIERQQQIEITITREKIVVPAISVSNRDGIEIIKIVQFGNSSASEMKTELESMAKKNPQAIIIDLRNNPGGFLNEVVTIVDYFIEKNNPIVYLKDRHNNESMDSTLDPIIKNIPIAVLINKGSASASEILAGALQSYGVAKVYGETSFGKGTVQNVISLQDPNDWIASAFKFTTAEYLVGGPNGKMVSIDGIGVKPLDNPNGSETPLLDDRETPADEALETVINLIKNPDGNRHR